MSSTNGKTLTFKKYLIYLYYSSEIRFYILVGKLGTNVLDLLKIVVRFHYLMIFLF